MVFTPLTKIMTLPCVHVPLHVRYLQTSWRSLIFSFIMIIPNSLVSRPAPRHTRQLPPTSQPKGCQPKGFTYLRHFAKRLPSSSKATRIGFILVHHLPDILRETRSL